MLQEQERRSEAAEILGAMRRALYVARELDAGWRRADKVGDWGTRDQLMVRAPAIRAALRAALYADMTVSQAFSARDALRRALVVARRFDRFAAIHPSICAGAGADIRYALREALAENSHSRISG